MSLPFKAHPTHPRQLLNIPSRHLKYIWPLRLIQPHQVSSLTAAHPIMWRPILTIYLSILRMMVLTILSLTMGLGYTSHTSSISLFSSTHSFDLHDILFVPDITQNCISISQFCSTNNASIEFLSSCFCIKTPKSISFSVKTTPSIWHRRLGHPDGCYPTPHTL